MRNPIQIGRVSSRLLLVPCFLALCHFGIATVPSAQADEIFNLTLTSTYPNSTFGGMGTLDLSQAPASTGNTFYTGSGTPSVKVTLTIDGVTFNSSGCSAEYSNAVLDSVYGCSFASVSGDSIYTLGLYGSSGNYGASFAGAPNGGSVGGNIVIGPGSVAAPEPSANLMYGMGLLSLLGLAVHRKSLV